MPVLLSSGSNSCSVVTPVPFLSFTDFSVSRESWQFIPPNPKYIPKSYEQMDYPGQRIQVDVKFVPSVCLKNSRVIGKQFFQYTAIDEYSRWRFVEAFAEHSTYSSAMFIEHLVKAFPLPIKCIQTDNGTEFTNRFTTHRNKPTLFQRHLEQHGIRHKVIRPFTPRHNGKVERTR